MLRAAGVVLLATLSVACSSSAPPRSDATTSVPGASRLANVTLHYVGPDPYGAPETTTLEVEGVVDPEHGAARVVLPVNADGVTEYYVDDTWYIQLPGTNNAQQYEAIELDGLTREELHPTGVQLAYITAGAAGVVALVEAARAEGTNPSVTVDLEKGSPALKALGVASGPKKLPVTRVFAANGTLQRVQARVPLPSGTAELVLTLREGSGSEPIGPPAAEQVLHR